MLVKTYSISDDIVKLINHPRTKGHQEVISGYQILPQHYQMQTLALRFFKHYWSL